VDSKLCDQCNVCLLLGCPAIQQRAEEIFIETSLCVGDGCSLCQQICPKKAINAAGVEGAKGK